MKSQLITIRLLALILLGMLPQTLRSEESLFPHCDRREDVVYGRKYGTALTLDVFAPKAKANGIGVIFVVSGGWSSRHDDISQYARPFIDQLAERGFTVFAVVHGSRPRYSIPEMIRDLERSVRYIRHHSDQFDIDRDRIGVCGASAGGHLSLMMGTDAKPGRPDAEDTVERESSQIQAVACLFPPTDFLNYGSPGENALGKGKLQDFHSVFEFRETLDRGRTIIPITDPAKILEIGRDISPVNHVSSGDPPTLIIHGDKDSIVPIQQSESIISKFESTNVPCRLVVRQGEDHGWKDYSPDIREFADWFDTHLKATK
jgi:acetyl esterase/lipase